MHVIAFEQKPDNRLGGQERSLFEVCRGLNKRGISVSLVYQKSGNILSNYQSFCKNTFRFSDSYQFCPNETYSFFKSLAKLLYLHWDEEWDAIYVNHYKHITLPAAFGLLVRRPVIGHLRLPPPHYLSRQYRWGLNCCEAVIAISHYIETEYQKAGVKSPEIPVVYNGVDLEKFDTGLEGKAKEGRRILYLGRITPLKGLDTLLEAFEIIVESRGDIALDIAGGEHGGQVPDGYKAGLKKRAEAIDGPIQFIPHQEDVRPLLSRADLVVVPSEWGEPFGRVVIEAMASRVPVVATRDGGIPEILAPEFEDHLVPAGDPEALAQALLRHVDWKREDPTLGDAIRAHVRENFSLESTLNNIAEVFRRVAEGRMDRGRARSSS